MSKVKLADLKPLAKFRVNAQGHVLVRGAITKGTKVGAYNPFKDLLWIEGDTIVTPFP